MITATGLTKSYGKITAVDNLSFQLLNGRVTGFLGPNGAGKSTTMRILAGLEVPDSGECLIDGTPPRINKNPMGTLGVLLDGQGALPGMRARAYLRSVAAAGGIGDARVDELLEIVDLTSAAGRRVGGFSLGMKQRLGLAVALLSDPQHVILDEPINGLDPDGVIWVRNLLRQLADEGRCVMLSSHLMSELEQCADDLIIIQDGSIVTSGSMGQVVSTVAAPQVTVRASDNERLHQVLTHIGASVDTHDSNLVVTGLSAYDIGEIAYQNGLAIHALIPSTTRLEDAYLSILRRETR